MHISKTPTSDRRNTEQLRVYRPHTTHWNRDRLLTSCSFGLAILTILLWFIGEGAMIKYALAMLFVALVLYFPVVLRHV